MTKPIDAETLVYGFEIAGDPQVAPDGSSIAYTLSKADRETEKAGSQIWRCGIDGGNPHRLTWTGEKNGGPRWSPDGRNIAFTSDRVEKSGLFVMPLEGGEPRELTRHAQGIGGLAWSPDGRSIAYTTAFDPDNPDEEKQPEDAAPKVRVTSRIDYKQDGRGYLGDVRTQIFIVDVETGERRRLTSHAVDYGFPQWSPDGTVIAAQVSLRNGMCSQLALVRLDSGAEKRVGPEDGVVASWAWSPDGNRIVYTGDTRQTWQTDFFVYDVDSEQVDRITEDLACLPQPAPAQPVWLDETRVLFDARRAGASGLYTIDLGSGEVSQIHADLTTEVGLSTDASNRYVAREHSSLESLGEISVYDLQRDTFSVITSYSEDVLREHPPAQWERFEIERNGFTIESWLLKPADFDPQKKYPVLLGVHGGPNGHYGYTYQPFQQLLAANGFLQVFSNPRGSSSYGREFTLQVARDWGGEDFQDLMAVLDHVLGRPEADTSRTGIWGYSYGGYMTSWTIGQTDRFQAAVCGAPCFDLESMYGTSDISHTFGELQWGGGPHDEQEWYEAHSPSTFAHNAVTPTLIVHGEADERCPIGQGEQMFVALKKAGCQVEFVRYPGASHGFLRLGPPPHRQDVLQRHLDWFKHHLGAPK